MRDAIGVTLLALAPALVFAADRLFRWSVYSDDATIVRVMAVSLVIVLLVALALLSLVLALYAFYP